MDYEKLYEKAIEGRIHHQQNFNHWMNMYAIFNGALFIGLYTILNNTTCNSFDLYRLIITGLGVIAGWFWHFSATSFHEWIKSWITVVCYYESKLKLNTNNEEDEKENEVFLYRLYGGKWSKRGKPFSTQELTKIFTFCVAIIWSILLVKFLIPFIPYIKDLNFSRFNSIIPILIGIAVIFAFFKARENLYSTHKKITGDLDTKYDISQLEKI